MPAQTFADPAQDIDSASDATTPRVDLLEVMQEMSIEERRRIYALQGLLAEYQAVRAQLRKEIAQLTKESVAACRTIFDTRRNIVTGASEVTAEELARVGITEAVAAEAAIKAPSAMKRASASSPPGGKKAKGVTIVDPVDAKQNTAMATAASSAAGGIPNFWLTAMSNSEALSSLITEKDRDALGYLTDIDKTFIDAEDPEKGDQLVFHFAPNPYFSNATLTKEYHTEYDEDHGEMRIADVVGCTIDWVSPKKNLTVMVKQKKQRNKKSGQMRVVEREEPCESFFNFFTPPTQKDEDEEDDDAEDEDDFFDQEMEMDVEAGTALMEAVVPRAIFYYTGESVVEMGKELREQFGFGEEEEDEDEEEESEEEDSEEEGKGGANFRNIVRQRGGAAGGRAGAGGRGRGGAAGGDQPPQPECKQQ